MLARVPCVQAVDLITLTTRNEAGLMPHCCAKSVYISRPCVTSLGQCRSHLTAKSNHRHACMPQHRPAIFYVAYLFCDMLHTHS